MRAKRPARSSKRRPRLGGAPRTSSLLSSSRTRSIATLPNTSSAWGMASRVRGSSARRRVEANRTARSGRSPSSRKRARGSPTDRRRRRSRSSTPENGSRSSPAMGSQAIAFTVKSPRARSPSMSARKVTELGRRPSRYRPSPRKVVTSTLCSPESTVTVPCCIPVGMTLGNSRTTCSGRASVATSKSCAAAPQRMSRTAPPASHACLDAPRSVRSTAITSAGTVFGSGCTPVSYHARTSLCWPLRVLGNLRRNGRRLGEYQLVRLHGEAELPAQHLNAEAALAQRGPKRTLGVNLRQGPGHLLDVLLYSLQDLQGHACRGLAHHDLHGLPLCHGGSKRLCMEEHWCHGLQVKTERFAVSQRTPASFLCLAIDVRAPTYRAARPISPKLSAKALPTPVGVEAGTDAEGGGRNGVLSERQDPRGGAHRQGSAVPWRQLDPRRQPFGTGLAGRRSPEGHVPSAEGRGDHVRHADERVRRQ